MGKVPCASCYFSCETVSRGHCFGGVVCKTQHSLIIWVEPCLLAVFSVFALPGSASVVGHA